jgi:hypothetical protein
MPGMDIAGAPVPAAPIRRGQARAPWCVRLTRGGEGYAKTAAQLSYSGWAVLVSRPGSALRTTDFIELGAVRPRPRPGPCGFWSGHGVFSLDFDGEGIQ